MTWLSKIKAPYAAVAVIILVAASVFLMAEGTVDSTAFKVGAVLIGGFVTRAAIAVANRRTEHGHPHGALYIHLTGMRRGLAACGYIQGPRYRRRSSRRGHGRTDGGRANARTAPETGLASTGLAFGA